MGNAKSGLQVQIASDLHIEYFDKDKRPNKEIYEHIVEPKAPVLALLGDIGNPGTDFGWTQFQALLQLLEPKFENIIIISGNHEFYVNFVPFNRVPLTVPQIHQRIQDYCDAHANIHYLNNSSLVLGGVRIVGSTLWSNISQEHEELIGRAMTDYSVSYMPNDDREAASVDTQEAAGEGTEVELEEAAKSEVGMGSGQVPPKKSADRWAAAGADTVRKLRVGDTRRFHQEAVKFIQAEAKLAKSEGQRMLVLTHHPPTTRNTTDPHAVRKSSPKVQSAFGTDLEHMFGFGRASNPYSAIHTWAFGHTHYNWTAKISGVRVVCNQLGYMGKQLADGYRQSCVVTV